MADEDLYVLSDSTEQEGLPPVVGRRSPGLELAVVVVTTGMLLAGIVMGLVSLGREYQVGPFPPSISRGPSELNCNGRDGRFSFWERGEDVSVNR